MTEARATILVVDDGVQNRRLLEALLQPEGYRTRTANSGQAALDSIAEEAPDLILLDVMMPGMSGYEVAATLKADEETAHIPIILVTAHTEREARLAGLDAGAEDYLTKPVDRAELWLRVRNLLRLKTLGDLLKNYNETLEQQVQARTMELQRFRNAMDTTGDAIFLVSRATMGFVEVNATATKMLGYQRDELLNMRPAEINDTTEELLETYYDTLIAGVRTNEFTEIEIHRKDGTTIPVEVHRHAQRSGDDWVIVGVWRDITERKEAERRLHHLAHYDPLTGLPNRTLFCEKLKRAVAQSENALWAVAVLFIDLDHFKNVNDSLGHTVGDELLTAVSDRLLQCVRPRDTVGRLSGDEFAVILTVVDGQLAATVANKIQEALLTPFDLSDHTITVTASIGIAVHPDDSSDSDTLIKYADTAMYRAKQAGRDTFRFFTALMNTEVRARLDLEAALRKAIENDEFVLHYQPKVELQNGRIVGVEALLRWQRPGHGLVYPGGFIHILEETGMIVDVGSWVIAAACEQAGHWKRSAIGPMQVSVNVAGRQFIEGDLDGDVIQGLHDNDIGAELLELELTETSLMEDTARTMATLRSLKEYGVQISIDDFGTGYSSLAYLHRFPIDKLKIDIDFVRGITRSRDDAAIALTIINMAHSLRMGVIAEGVETHAQLEFLRRHECDEVQGFYFCKPLPVPDIEIMLSAEGGSHPARPAAVPAPVLVASADH